MVKGLNIFILQIKTFKQVTWELDNLQSHSSDVHLRSRSSAKNWSTKGMKPSFNIFISREIS